MIPFVKMHGLGNDFIVVDLRDSGAPLPPEQVVALCDRHRGIGADGVLAILPSSLAPFAMHVTNSDGSIAEMCGNGIRCVVRYAIERKFLPSTGGAVETGRGVLECAVEPDGQVRVEMGKPEFERLPVSFMVDKGKRLQFYLVSMGNPHAVVFLKGAIDLKERALRDGPAYEHHPRFPQRTNVEFAAVRSHDRIDLAVWERGAGLTQACGTGACATAVAAVLSGRIKAGDNVRVTLPGGALRVLVEPDFSRVWMTGPAVEVFQGRVG